MGKCDLLLTWNEGPNISQGSIYWKILPPRGRNISRCHLGEKISKGQEKKEERGKKQREGEVKG